MNVSSTPQELFAISGKMGSGKDLLASIIQMMTCEDREIVEEFYESPKKTLDAYTGVFEMQSRFKNVKFADKVKRIVAEILGCTVRKLEDREFKEGELSSDWWYYIIEGEKIPYNETNYDDLEKLALEPYLVKLTPRKLLVLIATEGGREIIHPNIWTNTTFVNFVEDEEGNYPSWVISDLRFQNEYDKSVEKGAVTIRVVRYKLLSEWLSDYSIELSDMGEYENTMISDVDFLNFINEIDSEVLNDVSEKLNHISETDLDDVEHDYTIYNDGSIEDLVNIVREIMIEEGVELCDTTVPREV